MAIAWHAVIRSLGGTRPLSERDNCVALWRRLRRAFPGALGAVLMPNHVHLILPAGERSPAWLLRRASEAALPGAWQACPPAVPIPDEKHLVRQLRYVALNPCRANLCSDPLSWEWSTHLDSLGFLPDPWVPWSRIQPLARSPESWHKYVSADPSASPNGTSAPGALGFGSTDLGVPGAWVVGATLFLGRATAAELQSSRRSRLRALFLELATRECRLSRREIERWLGPLSRQAIHQRAGALPIPGLSAAFRRVLADRRVLELALEPAACILTKRQGNSSIDGPARALA